MESKAYQKGFLKKLAEYEKSAKMYYEMTPAERAEAEAKAKKLEAEELSKIPKRIVYDKPVNLLKPWEILEKKPETASEEWALLGRKLSRGVGSVARGIPAALGVTGVRALEGVYDLATFAPGLIDNILFGKIGRINGGRGLLGEYISKGHRFADKTVHGIRRWSSDYDEKVGINNKLNRFLQGAAADTAGTFLGFGGLHGLGVRGVSRIIGPAFGALGASGSLLDGQHKQLRLREETLRNMDPRFRQYFDATSTAYNQENAPTKREYRLYHLPNHGIATSYTGKLRIPWSWRHNDSGGLNKYREYGD